MHTKKYYEVKKKEDKYLITIFTYFVNKMRTTLKERYC